MLYSFDGAKAKSKRTTQYFELATNRAIYHDGWMACSRYGYPWVPAGRGHGFVKAPWELYNITDDFSKAIDLAAKEPENLKELIALWDAEAKKYNVFPLDDRRYEPVADPTRPVAALPKKQFRGKVALGYSGPEVAELQGGRAQETSNSWALSHGLKTPQTRRPSRVAPRYLLYE